MRASLERERARVMRGWSGRQTARLAIELDCVCKITPLVEGRRRKGRTGRRDSEADLSRSSLEKLTGCVADTVHKDRLRCQLIKN
jgi:hypothetical protein